MVKKNKQGIQINGSDPWDMCQYIVMAFGTEDVSIKLSL